MAGNGKGDKSTQRVRIEEKQGGQVRNPKAPKPPRATDKPAAPPAPKK